MTFDVIVLGLGGMGSATVAALARRDVRVLGLEQFPLVHHRGSSHGRSRIIRTAYYEHPAYVPLVRRAFQLWAELEQRTGRELLTACPCLCVGDPAGELVTGVKRSATEHDLPVESLTAKEVERLFPAFHVPEECCGVLEQSAGILAVEECVRAHLDDAVSTGRVELHSEEPVIEWRETGSVVEVRTARHTYTAGQLVVCAGAWANRTLATLGVPLRVMRQVQWWFPADTARYGPEEFPVFMLDAPGGAYYGLPAVDDLGVKCSRHYGAPELASPEEVDWTVAAGEETAVRDFLARHLPNLNGSPQASEVCMYTLSPDRHFVLDRLPATAHVTVACGFSGHGFKFAPVVGEVLADLALDGRTRHSIELFSARRFSR